MKRSRREEIAAKDKQNIWHPFAQMKEWAAAEPLAIERGEGCWLYDVDGNKYLDGVSSLWVTVHGHNRPEINNAIKAQLDRIAHSTLLGLTNPPAVELAERLVRIAPCGDGSRRLTKVFYSDNGSTATEIAIKMAYQYWSQQGGAARKKTKIARFNLGYHGDTLGAVSVGGIDLFHAVYKKLTFRTWGAHSPYCYRCPVDKSLPGCGIACLDSLEEWLKEHKGETAALIIEPVVQGAGGFIVAPEGHLRRVRELCDKSDVFLIADEVATGFGRTGKMFACEHEKVTPDFLCVAKGLTGGYLPLAATLTTQRVFDGFLGDHAEAKTFFHGHTYTGNPAACAAAIASLDLFKSDRTLQNMKPRIRQLANGLKKIGALKHVGSVRQKGFMVGIEVVQDKEKKTPWPFAENIGAKICAAARPKGVILRPLGPVIVLMPPLVISKEELDFLLNVVEESIRETTEAS